MPTPTTLHINWKACTARGLCTELLEEKLTQDPWGYPYSPQGSNIAIPPELKTAAREAAEACPLRALSLHTPQRPLNLPLPTYQDSDPTSPVN